MKTTPAFVKVIELRRGHPVDDAPIPSLTPLQMLTLAVIASHCGEHAKSSAPWKRAIAWPGRERIAISVWGVDAWGGNGERNLRRVLAQLRAAEALWMIGGDVEGRRRIEMGPGLASVSASEDVYIIPHLLTEAQRDAALVHFGPTKVRGAKGYAIGLQGRIAARAAPQRRTASAPERAPIPARVVKPGDRLKEFASHIPPQASTTPQGGGTPSPMKPTAPPPQAPAPAAQVSAEQAAANRRRLDGIFGRAASASTASPVVRADDPAANNTTARRAEALRCQALGVDAEAGDRRAEEALRALAEHSPEARAELAALDTRRSARATG